MSAKSARKRPTFRPSETVRTVKFVYPPYKGWDVPPTKGEYGPFWTIVVSVGGEDHSWYLDPDLKEELQELDPSKGDLLSVWKDSETGNAVVKKGSAPNSDRGPGPRQDVEPTESLIAGYAKCYAHFYCGASIFVPGIRDEDKAAFAATMSIEWSKTGREDLPVPEPDHNDGPYRGDDDVPW